MILKQNPIDFIVIESPILKEKGNNYSYYYLVKRNIDAFSAFNVISRTLRVDRKHIKYAGLKDKRAYTTQVISIPKRSGTVDDKPSKSLKEIHTKKITLKHIGNYKDPMFLGNLEKNTFIITIRELTKKEIEIIKSNENKLLRLKNYFDEQRFSNNNVEIGRAIVKKDFKKALELMDLHPVDNDYLKHLGKIPKKQLKLYIHAYQSYLWNKAIENINIKELDLFGFGINEDHVKYYKDIIKEESISERDFIIRQLPDMSCEGVKRDIEVNFKYKITNITNDTATIVFNLQKGSYATMMVKQLLK